MRPLPVHFVTIVLNGRPFLRHHAETFRSLPFPWHWHVVEGVASLAHDTAWSLTTGGRIDASFHRAGRSVDGTEEELDVLAREFPHEVTVYRKPRGEFWDGKIEMVSAPLARMRRACLLWEVDVDELWTADQLVRGRELFLAHPDRRAAYYRCVYFVGPDLFVATRDGYGNGDYEWLRTWRYRPGDRWLAHEPPVLVTRWERWRQWRRLRRGKRPRLPFHPGDPSVFSKEETEAHGLVFQHLAYVLDAQIRFKESYYGYPALAARWRAMQAETALPLRLREWFPWVRDDSLVDRASSHGLAPFVATPAPEGPDTDRRGPA